MVTINGNVNVAAAFKMTQFTVNASVSGSHGRVNPASQKVSYGAPASIAIIPNPKYRVASIIDNGQSMPISKPYVIEDVTADHSVAVVFAPDK